VKLFHSTDWHTLGHVEVKIFANDLEVHTENIEARVYTDVIDTTFTLGNDL